MQMAKYRLEINGVDFSDMVEIDSYSTSRTAVYSEKVTTMDGVDHVVPLRHRGTLTVGLNPQTSANTVRLCNALTASRLDVIYHCLQRDVDVSAQMVLDSISSQHLGRVKYLGQRWNETSPITLQEL